MVEIKNYIGGKWQHPSQTIDVIDPATGKVYGQVSKSDEKSVINAIDFANEDADGWRHYTMQQRSDIMLKIADLIDHNLNDLAEAESLDNGKPLWLSKNVDIPRASANMRFFANAILQFSNDAYDMDGKAMNYTLRKPLGIVTCISPWNLPLYLFTWKIAPALAAGNYVLAKPSEVTPYTAYLFGKLCKEAGLPDAALQIINGLGHEVGPTLCSHKDIKAISFTGSTQTGATIAAMSSPMFKKISLEMGGKNPNIIFDDCNYEKALKTTIQSSFSNQGQICLCGSRIYVQRKIYDRFKNDLVALTKDLKVGHPMAADTKVGAIVSEAHMNKILSYFDLAIQEGGSILTGGKRALLDGEQEDGFYIYPTIIENLSPKCRTNLEEIFGPVVSITPFDTVEEAIALANSTDYGLSCTIWTQDIDRANSVSRGVDAGIVWVNTWLTRDLRTPFGGMKNSGVGREGGFDALRFFTEVKNVCIGF